MRKLTFKNIDGRVIRYADWLAETRRLAEERQIPERVLEQATNPILKDAFTNKELPAHFLDKLVEWAN